jgi:hypothetical protein
LCYAAGSGINGSETYKHKITKQTEEAMVRTKYKKLTQLTVVVGLVAAAILPTVLASQAQAAAFTVAMVRFDRMKISQATTGTVCVRPATTSADVKTWQVTFPTGYTVSTTAANWQAANVSTTNLAWPSGAVAWPNATGATAAVSGQTVTWTNASVQTMNNSTTYCYNWTSAAAVSVQSGTSSTNTGTVNTRNSSAVDIDSSSYVTSSITDDQISVSATVPQAFSFALNANSDSLGTLSSGSITQSASGVIATVNTNAKNGFKVWARSANAGLNSVSASKTIAAANGPLSAGTEGYAFGVTVTQTSGSGSPAASGSFAGGVAGTGGALATALSEVVSSAGTANNAQLTLRNNVAISGITPAASDYTDVITVVGAGMF